MALKIWADCLMPNRVRLLVVLHGEDSTAALRAQGEPGARLLWTSVSEPFSYRVGCGSSMVCGAVCGPELGAGANGVGRRSIRGRVAATTGACDPSGVLKMCKVAIPGNFLSEVQKVLAFARRALPL